MDVVIKPREVYRPIKRYQTRIMRLHSHNGAPDSPLMCNLYPTDILDPAFEGLGIRSPSNEEEHLVEFDALSYTWGSNDEDIDNIICNGVDLPISQNLSEALRTLRHSEEGRYLWVDAICINQSDHREKSEQVWNMLLIYRKATSVIAWLGPAQEEHAQEDVNNALVAASSISQNLSPENIFDVWSILGGFSYLYTRPWFQRIWIQQEIFAARNLKLQCGTLSFEWSQLLSEPNLLLRLPHLQAYIKSKDKRGKKKSEIRGADEILAQVDALSTLDRLHVRNLNCFERFSTKDRVRPDFIETLLDTSGLGATNPSDYTYGIIGITGFPAKAMPFQEWMTARQREVLIPIDYSADLTSLLCAVSWAMLMKGGLAVLAKFKVFAFDDGTSEQSLPSWVIDWRLAGRLFSRKLPPEVGDNDGLLKIENAWEIRVPSDTPLARTIYNTWKKLIPWPPPAEHEQFCEDNRNSTIPCTEIILRGVIDLRFYAKGKSVWEKKKLFKDKAVWHLEVDVYPTDLVVYMHNFAGVGFRGLSMSDNTGAGAEYCNGGPWLLRPAGPNAFKLIACLSLIPNVLRPLYDHWEWNPGHFQETSVQQQPANQYRPLAVDPVKDVLFYGMPTEHNESAETREFIIIWNHSRTMLGWQHCIYYKQCLTRRH